MLDETAAVQPLLALNRLSTYYFDPDANRSEEKACVVCEHHFEVQDLVCVLPCSHEFHAVCAYQGLGDDCICPLCGMDAAGEEL